MANTEVVKKQKPKKEKGEGNWFTRKVKETWSELKKVSWPTFPTVVKNTAIVLAVVAIFLVILLVFDIILTYFAYNPLSNGTIFGGGSTETESLLSAAKGLITKTQSFITGRAL